jgi:hypothetical protein
MRAWVFQGMGGLEEWSVAEKRIGKQKKLCLATEPANILVVLTWLSLVGLLPSRARLRFTRSTSAVKLENKNSSYRRR